MISSNDLRKGTIFKFQNELYEVHSYQHVKPGKGGAFIKTKIKNLHSGVIKEHTFRAGEKLEDVVLENKKMLYSYNDGENIIIMDNESYEQFSHPMNDTEETLKYVKEGETLEVSFYQGNIFKVAPPLFVILQVTEAEPGIKGDTANNPTKFVTMETGYRLQVPLFINEGDKLKIDTRNGEYVERA